MDLKKYIADIQDFPQKGILFRDMTPLLQDGKAFRYAIDQLATFAKNQGAELIVGPEARGFIFGMPIAYNLNKGFVPVRKPGKLPREVISQDYELEYGTSILQMHKDAIKKGDRVVIIDDLIATGGTTQAIVKLVEKLGGKVVLICSLIELVDLKARELLKEYNIKSCVKFKGE